jgi:archaellum component FlaC
MANNQVLSALEDLHKELNSLAPAIEHIQTAQQVTQTVKDIPNRHIELLNDLKALFEKELIQITEENKKVSKTTSDLQVEIKKELEEISKLHKVVNSFYDKVVQINFPERLDKVDANVAGIMAAIQSTQSRLDNIERNLSDKMRDLSDRQKED